MPGVGVQGGEGGGVERVEERGEVGGGWGKKGGAFTPRSPVVAASHPLPPPPPSRTGRVERGVERRTAALALERRRRAQGRHGRQGGRERGFRGRRHGGGRVGRAAAPRVCGRPRRFPTPRRRYPPRPPPLAPRAAPARRTRPPGRPTPPSTSPHAHARRAMAAPFSLNAGDVQAIIGGDVGRKPVLQCIGERGREAGRGCARASGGGGAAAGGYWPRAARALA